MKKRITILVLAILVLGLVSTGVAQAAPGTKYIRDDATGGDCTSIGVWNSMTKTCKLTKDLSEPIEIASDSVTLDGNRHTITGGSSGNGVSLVGRTGVTIKNLKVRGFELGVRLQASTKTTLTGLSLSDATGAGIKFFSASTYNKVTHTILANNVIGIDGGDQGSHHNTFEHIVAHSNTRVGFTAYAGSDYTRILHSLFYNNGVGVQGGGSGILLGWSGNWSIENCIIHSNKGDGIALDTVHDGTIKDSMIYSNKGNGISYAGLGTTNNLVTHNRIYSNNMGLGFWSYARGNIAKENTIEHNGTGVLISKNDIGPNYDNLFYRNNLENPVNASVLEDRYPNRWDNGLPAGGNYWSNYHTPAQGCQDLNHDGFCDAPYVLTGGRDNFPWTTSYGWFVADVNKLIQDKERACTQGWINKKGVCLSLDAKLIAARAAIKEGRFEVAKGLLYAFIHELDAQKGKAVNQQAYDLLKADALYVINKLP